MGIPESSVPYLAYMQARAQKYHLEKVSTTFGVPSRMCGHAPSKYHLEPKVPHSAEYKYMSFYA